MILLDTNVIIYAMDRGSPFCQWARETIAGAVATDGAAVNAVSLAELCIGAVNPDNVAENLLDWGITLLDVPWTVSQEAAFAYHEYRKKSRKQMPAMPLPDFFIGAHALTMDWDLATADKGRFKTCFPQVRLRMP